MDVSARRRIDTELPHAVRCEETVWITMSDGIRLAARLWIPVGAEEDPVPAILEYIPYRRRDRTRVRDSMNHAWTAGHGYACLRVDMRGSGDSEGLLTDEYLQQELDDGVEVIRWIADQPWCDGTVGMVGISWGGFNGLQIAALQPPELKAVISVCSTDDRYADDIHYMGGCLLGDNLSWASIMFHRNSMPPDPAVVGEDWRDLWYRRLDGSGLWLETWLRHQRRDHYWKHGSVCEDPARIRCPVLAVSGWADGYSNAVFRLVESLDAPAHGLIGPWSHRYPHDGVPGPAIGFLQESLRWWDHWLKGEDRGLDDEPRLRAWMQDSVSPSAHYEERPGRWVAEPGWPSPRIEERTWKLSPLRLESADADVPETQFYVCSPLRLGLYAGKWCSYAGPPDLPGDQREEDGGALVFDSEPLDEAVEILGAPTVELELSADRPVAMVAVRLSDVRSDHRANRVTYGLLNLTHRDGHEHPEPLEPGRRYRVRVDMNHVAHTFPVGHRLRLAVSTSYWPLAWTPPAVAELTVTGGRSTMTLPVRPPRTEDAELRAFEPPATAPGTPTRRIHPRQHGWTVHRDLATDRATLEVLKDEGLVRLEDIELDFEESSREWYTVEDDRADTARGEADWRYRLRRDGWEVRARTRTVLTSDAEFFHLHAQLDAWEGERRVYSRNWTRRIPRDLV